MRAIKSTFAALLISAAIFSSFAASSAFAQVHARDESWSIFQFRKKLDGGHQVFAEYVRRDRGDLFTNKNLDLFRISYGGKIEGSQWGHLVGAAFVDFETGGDERRLHQFALYNRSFDGVVGILGRFGFEQRQFNGDEGVYWRIRNRVQLNWLPQFTFGPSIYDEILYAVDGRMRFQTGFNENRFGLGVRFHTDDLEVLLYHTAAHLKTLRRDDRVEWLQLQTVYSF
jgi:hypothetical protein